MCFYCCLSSILKYSVVLLQSRYDLEDCGRIVMIDIALLLKKIDGSATDLEQGWAYVKKNLQIWNHLDDLSSRFEWFTVGYICILRLQKERESGLFHDNEKHKLVSLKFEFWDSPLTSKVIYRYDLEDCGGIVTIDIALLLKKFDGSATDIGAKMGLCQEKFANLKSFRWSFK